MHCHSCQNLIEGEVGDLAGVKKIKVDLKNDSADLEYDEKEISEEKIFAKIKELKYHPAPLDQKLTAKGSSQTGRGLILAGALLIAFLIIYSVIQRSGVLEIFLRLNDPRIGYGLIFAIGILASFHCVGMCGGFVAAYSAAEIEKGRKASLKIHAQYNLGRLISYTLSGLLLGAFGSIVQINGTISGLLLVAAGVFMMIMGLSLLTNWRILDKIKLKMPRFVGKIIRQSPESSRPKGPFIIGLLTAMMPCGPLQAMQLYALGTGNPWQGGLSMALYAAGTIPVMLAFGGFISLLTRERIKNLLKISGAIVIVLGLMTAARGASDFGFLKKPSKIINELSGKKDISAEQYFADSVPTDKYQTVEMSITASGFKPNIIHLKRGLPVRWIIKDGGVSGCTNQVILYNGGQELKYKINSPQTIVKFMPSGKSEIKFSCWMKMVWGKFVFDDTSEAQTAPSQIEAESNKSSSCSAISSGSCSGQNKNGSGENSSCGAASNSGSDNNSGGGGCGCGCGG